MERGLSFLLGVVCLAKHNKKPTQQQHNPHTKLPVTCYPLLHPTPASTAPNLLRIVEGVSSSSRLTSTYMYLLLLPPLSWTQPFTGPRIFVSFDTVQAIEKVTNARTVIGEVYLARGRKRLEDERDR